MPDSTDESFPASKLERGKIFAKTGLKVGANYARYLADRVTKGEDDGTRKRALNTQNAEDLYREFTKLRGTALKLAQSMSMNTGVLPEEFMDVMAAAQYQVPPMNRALVQKRVRDGLGQYPAQLFDAFEAEAMAAASDTRARPSESMRSLKSVGCVIGKSFRGDRVAPGLAAALPADKQAGGPVGANTQQ